MKENQLGFFTKLGYGVGQTAEGIKNNAFEIFLFFYYTQVLGLTGTLAGLSMFIALFVDGITDPLIGTLSDNSRTKWGRRHPWMYASIVPLSLSFYFLFSPPESLSQIQLFFWLTLFAICVRVFITFFQVPYLALGAELSSDYAERSSVVGYRTAFSILGGTALVIIGFSIFFKPTALFTEGQLNPQGYSGFGLFFAITMAIAIILCAFATHRFIPRLSIPSRQQSQMNIKLFFVEIKTIFQSAPFRVLFFSMLLFSIMRGVQNTLSMHATTYFWQLTTEQIQFVTLALILGLLAGIPFARPLSRWFDKKWIFVCGIVWAMLFHVLPITMKLLHFLPEDNGPSLMAFLITASLLGGMGAVQAIVAAGSMIADISDLHEHKIGQRKEGLLFGGLSFAGKTASGVGHIVAGIAIDLIAFPINVKPGEISQDTITNLALIYGPGVSLLGVAALVIFLSYSLPKTHLSTIQDELKLRQQL